MDRIYTVTSVNIEQPVPRTRCWGYYFSKNEAIEAVKNNTGDLVECGYYSHAVIEEIKEGILQVDLTPLWFRFTDQEVGKAVEIDRPPDQIGIVNYGMG